TGHADLPRRADHAELHTLLVIVVGAVLRVRDSDVHVEPAGEELDRLNREADDALGLDRHRDPVDAGVRPEDADAVVAIEVHAEDRIAHTLGVAVPDLDRGGLTRLEHDALGAIWTDHPRARDLDLLRAPPRADLAARGALALLLFADLLAVRVDDVVRRALRADDPLVEPHRALAEACDRAEIVRHEHDRLLRGAELADLREALVLDVLVADREHLIDKEDVRLEMHRDREAKTHVHAARVGL